MLQQLQSHNFMPIARELAMTYASVLDVNRPTLTNEQIINILTSTLFQQLNYIVSKQPS